jgi:hypothetical protein
MKRKIVVSTEHVTITAVLHSQKNLMREEIEAARDGLADDLMKAATNIRFMSTALSRVKVR